MRVEKAVPVSVGSCKDGSWEHLCSYMISAIVLCETSAEPPIMLWSQAVSHMF